MSISAVNKYALASYKQLSRQTIGVIFPPKNKQPMKNFFWQFYEMNKQFGAIQSKEKIVLFKEQKQHTFYASAEASSSHTVLVCHPL